MDANCWIASCPSLAFCPAFGLQILLRFGILLRSFMALYQSCSWLGDVKLHLSQTEAASNVWLQMSSKKTSRKCIKVQAKLGHFYYNFNLCRSAVFFGDREVNWTGLLQWGNCWIARIACLFVCELYGLHCSFNSYQDSHGNTVLRLPRPRLLFTANLTSVGVVHGAP